MEIFGLTGLNYNVVTAPAYVGLCLCANEKTAALSKPPAVIILPLPPSTVWGEKRAILAEEIAK